MGSEWPTDLLLLHADPEVGLVEFIGNVPAQSSKLSPLLHHGVEEAEPKEKFPPGFGLGGGGRGGALINRYTGLMRTA